MSSRRDDMVIVPRLKRRNETGPRERAKQERQTEHRQRRKRRRLSRLRRSAAARRAIDRRRSRRTGVPVGGRGAVKAAVRGASRVVGVAAVAAEAAIALGQAVRAVEHGFSGRLIDAQDAHTIYGDLDERFTAAANTRGFFESRPDVLRAIRNKGHFSEGLKQVSADMQELEMRFLQGADAIERDPAFDSADDVVNQVNKIAGEMGLKTVAHEVLEVMRKYFWFRGWFK